MDDVLYANVIVDVNSSHVDIEYEYVVPPEFIPFISIGARVAVPFGSSNRLVLGYVTETYATKRFEGEAKAIATLLDYEPLISDEQMKLARYLKQETISTFVSAIKLMVPKLLRLKATRYVYVNDYEHLDADLALVISGRQMVRLDQQFRDYSYKLSKEIKKGTIEIRYGLKDRGSVRIASRYLIDLPFYHQFMVDVRSTRQKDFLCAFEANDQPLLMEEITERYGVSEWIVKTLIKRGYLHEIVTEVSRIRKRVLDYRRSFSPDERMTKAADDIINATGPTLFHITRGEDVTKLLVELIRRYLNGGKQILIVVPNVVLVYKISSIIRMSRIDAETVTFTGEISDGEFHDAYQAVRKGEVDIVVTSTVGAFAPLPSIGLIVMLDEENQCYFNDQSPRYDMHKVLEFRAEYHHAQLLLMSVAPSVATYTKAMKGKYHLIAEKASDEIAASVIDLTHELKSGNRTPLGVELKQAIDEALINHQQVLLILNTRGYSRFVLCRECGEVIRCPKCGLSLSYHQQSNKLKCSACGYQRPFVQECPKCHSTYIRHMGFGIEQLSQFITQTFKEASVITFDEENFEEFSEKMSMIVSRECDIIIAPDVYSKAIMTSGIALVGILALDLVLNMPSYLATERAYAMLSHARFHLAENPGGKMIIQTYKPDHHLIRHFLNNDYVAFYDEELDARESAFNEPFYQVNKILIKGAYKEAYKTGDLIRKVILELIKKNVYVLGPSYSNKEQAVQLIIKHQFEGINKIYQTIYEKYQTSDLVIIFQKYAQDLS